MYWTSIFLVGEWAIIDFSEGAGSRLCIFYCVFGIMVFAIPVGVIGEALHSTLIMEHQATAKMQDVDETNERLERMLVGHRKSGESRSSLKGERRGSKDSTLAGRKASLPSAPGRKESAA